MPIRILLALMLFPAVLGAQQPTAIAAPPSSSEAPIEGVFLYDQEASDDLDAIVDRGVSLVKSWLKRQFAAGRIRDTNRPAQWVQIRPLEDTVVVRTDLADLRIPYAGGIQDWERKEGDFIDVAARWEGGRLIQRFEGEDGTRTNTYRLEGDGDTLRMDVKVESDQLKGPLEYTMVYRRQDPGVDHLSNAR